MQSKKRSLFESITNVIVGYGIGVLSYSIVLPWFGVETPTSTILQIGVIFTIISIIRSYILRRIYNWIDETF